MWISGSSSKSCAPCQRTWALMQQREHGKQRGNLRKQLQANPTKHAFCEGLGSRTSSRPPRPNRFGCVGVYCGCLRYCCPMVATGRSVSRSASSHTGRRCIRVAGRRPPYLLGQRRLVVEIVAGVQAPPPEQAAVHHHAAHRQHSLQSSVLAPRILRLGTSTRACMRASVCVRTRMLLYACTHGHAHAPSHVHTHARTGMHMPGTHLCVIHARLSAGSSWMPLCRDGKARAGQYRQPSRAIERRGNAAQRP